MKRIVALLIVSMLVGMSFVEIAGANPWMGNDWISPKNGTKPPVFTISSPQENMLYNSSTIFLNFTSIVGESNASFTWLMQVYYMTDWEPKENWVYKNTDINIPYDPNGITNFSYNINLTGVPEGKHSIIFHAFERGSYIEGLYFHMFDINGSSSVNFTIDTLPPVSSILQPENKEYSQSDVILDLAINEQVSTISYSLDGQANITIAGNSTLTDLSNGYHNITAYATDEVGNVGASDTIYFSVDKPSFLSINIVPIVLIIFLVLAVAAPVIFRARHSKMNANK